MEKYIKDLTVTEFLELINNSRIRNESVDYGPLDTIIKERFSPNDIGTNSKTLRSYISGAIPNGSYYSMQAIGRRLKFHGYHRYILRLGENVHSMYKLSIKTE